MKVAKVKVPAKINLTLDIVGKEKDFHEIRSLVTTVSIYDKIKIRERKDNQVTLKVKGNCDCSEKENNAYKAAKLFVDTFNTRGVDVILKKRIPFASGMGGSSADIVGVLSAMKKIYKEKGDIIPLATKLGSDTVCMLHPGYSVISGKGDEIIPVKSKIKLYVLIICDDIRISAKEGYAGYDKLKEKFDSVTYDAVSYLINVKEDFFNILKNDLQPYAESVLPSLIKKQKELVKSGAKCALMTGSGSAVYGLFLTKKERNTAYKKLHNKYGNNLFKCNTVR